MTSRPPRPASVFTSWNLPRPVRTIGHLLLALIASWLLFASVPFAASLLAGHTKADTPNHSTGQVTVNLKMKKEKKRPPPPKPLRSLSTARARASARSLSLKFSPDLSIGDGSGVAVSQSDLQNMVFEEGETDVPTQPLSRPMPPLPPKARELGAAGIVDMIIVIGRDGRVSSVDFKRMPHPIYRETTLRYVKQWRFKPAQKNGVPVRVRVRQQIEFKLE